ncbi:toprim domain-containing protein [Paenibacillus cremeus]|uniref:toprim domain-containing protein n=1 Tax=Paenibacillus cremeus TaxID=2163881 RepID=UPI0021BD45D1|nr:toprim domain-containing protein [Paenibacillus cremeus]
MPKISQSTIDAVEFVHTYDLAMRMGHWTKTSGGGSIKVECPNPNHIEKTPDTYIKKSTGIFMCYGGGGCGAKGKALQYYAWSTWGCWDPKTHFIDAVIGVCELMGIPIEYDGPVQDSIQKRVRPAIQPAAAPKAVFEDVPAQPAEVCDRVYRRFLELCPIYQEHAEEWMTKRRYTKEQINAFGLRSIPATWPESKLIVDTLLKEGYSLERIPGFTLKLRKGGNPLNEKDWYWAINAYGKYFLPVRDDTGRIVRLRMATGQEKKKYTWFSSGPNVEVQKNSTGQITELKVLDPSLDINANPHEMRRGGASSSHHINVVLPYQAHSEQGQEVMDIFTFDSVVITEGEHKAFYAASILRKPVIGIPGAGNYRDVLPVLKKWGVKKAVVAYDADAFITKDKDGQKQKNEQVFKNLIDFSKEILESDGIELVFWIWNIADGKGLDDVLMGGKLPMEVNPRTKTRVPVTI